MANIKDRNDAREYGKNDSKKKRIENFRFWGSRSRAKCREQKRNQIKLDI